MNIAPTFPEEPLLHLSSLQGRDPRADSATAYEDAMAEFRKRRDEAHALRKWVDKDRSWSVPYGWLEDQIRSERAAAVECWAKARDIKARMDR